MKRIYGARITVALMRDFLLSLGDRCRVPKRYMNFGRAAIGGLLYFDILCHSEAACG